jgi:hypothetical protein
MAMRSTIRTPAATSTGPISLVCSSALQFLVSNPCLSVLSPCREPWETHREKRLELQGSDTNVCFQLGTFSFERPASRIYPSILPSRSVRNYLGTSSLHFSTRQNYGSCQNRNHPSSRPGGFGTQIGYDPPNRQTGLAECCLSRRKQRAAPHSKRQNFGSSAFISLHLTTRHLPPKLIGKHKSRVTHPSPLPTHHYSLITGSQHV